MATKPRPIPRLAPLPADRDPSLKPVFDAAVRNLGFIPNSQLIMQRKPKILAAFSALYAAIWDPEGEVDRGFKRLLAYVSSRVAGCQYCQAHTAGGALRMGVSEEKLAAVWSYKTSALYTDRERVALDVAVAAAAVPNDVSDELFDTLKQYWTDSEIVEIVSLIALFGFLNRFNDTLATPLEDEPRAVGEQFLAASGWTVGRHG